MKRLHCVLPLRWQRFKFIKELELSDNEKLRLENANLQLNKLPDDIEITNNF